MLTSPLYIGRLRDATPAHWPPVVDEAIWEQVQVARARRATNTGRPADPRRPYALSKLYCAACGKRLTGDTGYYRHRNVCDALVAARTPQARHGRGRSAGHAYPMEPYEQIVEGILGQASLGASTLAAVVGEVVPPSSGPDAAALPRIAREREQAMTRYLRDRDTATLDASMRRLDADEARARVAREGAGVPADKAAQALRELPITWAKAEGGTGRQLVADALFERIEVLGLQEVTAQLSEHAIRHGLADVLPEEFGISVSGRGERI